MVFGSSVRPGGGLYAGSLAVVFSKKREGKQRSSAFLFHFSNAADQGWVAEVICMAVSSALTVPGQLRASPPQLPVTVQPAATVMLTEA